MTEQKPVKIAISPGLCKRGIGLLFEKADNRMNPVVVKELRQAMRSRMITGLMMLFLLAQILVLSVELADNAGTSWNMYAGREIFEILLGVLMFTGILCLPAYAAFRLGAERMGTDVDLIFITTLSPSRIISGKFMANLMLAVVIYSACMPFMTFTYLLRGIDMPTIFACLAFGMFMISLCIMGGIFFACVPASKTLKLLLGLGCAGGLFGLFTLTLEICQDLMRQGLNSPDFWEIALTSMGIMLAATGLFYVLATSLIMPPAANRALPIRIFTATTWLISGVIIIIYCTLWKDNDPLLAWCIISSTVSCAGLLMAISERQELGARIARKIPKNRLLRLPAFLFFSGTAGGMVFFSLLALLTLGIVFFALSSASFVLSGRCEETLIGCAGMFLSVFSYSMFAVWMRRIFFEKRIPHYHTWALVLFLTAVGVLLPLILTAMISSRGLESDNVLIWLGNPFAAFNVYGSTREIFFVWVIAWSVIMGLANLSLFISQIRRFQPYTEGE